MRRWKVKELDLEQEFISFVKKEKLWSSSDTVLIALSGGVDSIVLTHLLHNLPKNLRPHVYLAHINHQLREGSVSEESYIKELAENLTIPLYTHTWNKELHPKTNLENKAREMRYDFFDKVMDKNDISILLTAHHLGDQAETVLMKLIRGGLIENKRGIELKQPFRGRKLIRPLLPFAKQLLYNYAHENNLTYFEDQTNHTDLYERNRMRRNIIPNLKRENPNAEKHLYDFSNELKDLIDIVTPVISEKKETFLTRENNSWKLSLNDFQQEKWSIRYYVMIEILKEVFIDSQSFNKKHVELLLEWLDTSTPNSSYQLSNDWIVQKEYQTAFFQKVMNENSSKSHTFILNENEWIRLSSTEKVGLFTEEKKVENSDLVIYCKSGEISLPVTIRHRENGDRMTLKGRKGTKKIKDIFIDQKIPAKERDEAWVLEDARGQIIWLVGYKESQLSKDLITDKMNYIFLYRSMKD